MDVHTIVQVPYRRAGQAADTLCRAFAQDPLVTLLGAQQPGGVCHTRALFAFNARYCALRGRATATAGYEGVALWLPARALQAPLGLWLLCGGGCIRRQLGARASDMIQHVGSTLDGRRAAFAPGDYEYLSNLGVLPTHRRQGVARALLRPVLEQCAALGRPVLVETNTPQALAFYQSLGFVCRDRVEIFGITYYFLQYSYGG